MKHVDKGITCLSWVFSHDLFRRDRTCVAFGSLIYAEIYL